MVLLAHKKDFFLELTKEKKTRREMRFWHLFTFVAAACLSAVEAHASCVPACTAEICASSYGTAAFVALDGGFEPVSAPAFPDFVSLPGDRNAGKVTGSSLLLSESGLISTTTGDFHVDLSVELLGNETGTNAFSVFLVANENLDLVTFNLAGASATVPEAQIVHFQGAGIISLARNDELSLIVSRSNPGPDAPAVVVSWGMVAERLSQPSCCGPVVCP